jgi:hypothetical protein
MNFRSMIVMVAAGLLAAAATANAQTSSDRAATSPNLPRDSAAGGSAPVGKALPSQVVASPRGSTSSALPQPPRAALGPTQVK